MNTGRKSQSPSRLRILSAEVSGQVMGADEAALSEDVSPLQRTARRSSWC